MTHTEKVVIKQLGENLTKAALYSLGNNEANLMRLRSLVHSAADMLTSMANNARIVSHEPELPVSPKTTSDELDNFINGWIGLAINAPDNTPMDKGECKIVATQWLKKHQKSI